MLSLCSYAVERGPDAQSPPIVRGGMEREGVILALDGKGLPTGELLEERRSSVFTRVSKADTPGGANFQRSLSITSKWEILKNYPWSTTMEARASGVTN